MRKAIIYIILCLCTVVSLSAREVSVEPMPGKVVEMQGSFLQPLQERDSVLIADQVFYGVELKQVEEGTVLAFPQFKDTLMTNIRVVRPWTMDTVRVKKQKKGQPGLMDLRGGVTIIPLLLLPECLLPSLRTTLMQTAVLIFPLLFVLIWVAQRRSFLRDNKR